MMCIRSTGGGSRFGFSFSAEIPQKFAPQASATMLLFRVTFVSTVSIPYDRTAIGEPLIKIKKKKIIDY